MTRQMIDFEGMVNCRDLGGLALENGKITRGGVLLRGETPQMMTAADVARARDELGLGLIVDLRGGSRSLGAIPGGSGEIGEQVARVNLDFISLAGGTDKVGLTIDTFFLSLLDVGAGPMAAFLEHFTQTDAPVLVHCHTGKDRTGFVVAMTLALAGVKDDEIIADYAMSSPVFDQMMANLREKGMPVVPEAPAFAHHPPSVDSMTELLSEIRRRWGSARTWATEHGISPDLIDAARTRLAG